MVANVITTHKCNLRCRHCFYIEKLVYEDNNVSSENWSILETKREELGIDKYNFTGGEATMCQKLLSYFSDCKQNNVAFSLFTNGISITPQTIDCCDEYYLSIDGVGQIHDSVRNMNGAYEKVKDLLQIMKNQDKKIHIQTTISKINIDHLKPVIELYVDLIPQLKSISLVATVNQGNTLNNGISLAKSELIKIKEFKEEILEKFYYQVMVKDNLYTLTQLREFVLSDRSAFPMWIDLISGEAYVMTDEYKVGIKNLSADWLNEQYHQIRKKISQRVIWSDDNLYIIEDLL